MAIKFAKKNIHKNVTFKINNVSDISNTATCEISRSVENCCFVCIYYKIQSWIQCVGNES